MQHQKSFMKEILKTLLTQLGKILFFLVTVICNIQLVVAQSNRNITKTNLSLELTELVQAISPKSKDLIEIESLEHIFGRVEKWGGSLFLSPFPYLFIQVDGEWLDSTKMKVSTTTNLIGNPDLHQNSECDKLNLLLESDNPETRKRANIWLTKMWHLYYANLGKGIGSSKEYDAMLGPSSNLELIKACSAEYWHQIKPMTVTYLERGFRKSELVLSKRLENIVEPDWTEISIGEVLDYFGSGKMSPFSVEIDFVHPVKWHMVRGGDKLFPPSHPEYGDWSWAGTPFGLDNIEEDSKAGMWIRDVLLGRLAFEELATGTLPPWASRAEKNFIEAALEEWWKMEK